MCFTQIPYLQHSINNPILHLDFNEEVELERPDQFTFDIEIVPDVTPGERFNNDFDIEALNPFRRFSGLETVTAFEISLDELGRIDPSQSQELIHRTLTNFRQFVQEFTPKEIQLMRERNIPLNNIPELDLNQGPAHYFDILWHRWAQEPDFLEDLYLSQERLITVNFNPGVESESVNHQKEKIEIIDNIESPLTDNNNLSLLKRDPIIIAEKVESVNHQEEKIELVKQNPFESLILNKELDIDLKAYDQSTFKRCKVNEDVSKHLKKIKIDFTQQGCEEKPEGQNKNISELDDFDDLL